MGVCPPCLYTVFLSCKTHLLQLRRGGDDSVPFYKSCGANFNLTSDAPPKPLIHARTLKKLGVIIVDK